MIKAVIFDYDWVLSRYYVKRQKDLFKLAEELRSLGFKTAILSNRIFPLSWTARLRGQLTGFEPVIFARKTGKPKPHPHGYEAVLTSLGLEPKDCLFVDNNKNNVAAAKALGMTSILVVNTNQIIKDIKEMLKVK